MTLLCVGLQKINTAVWISWENLFSKMILPCYSNRKIEVFTLHSGYRWILGGKALDPGQQSWRTCKGGQKTDGWFSFVSEKHTALRSGAFKEKFLIFNNYKFSSDLLGSAAAMFISLSLLPLWTQFHREVIKLVISSPNRCECLSPFGAQLTDGIGHGLPHHHSLRNTSLHCVWSTAHSGSLPSVSRATILT